MSFSLETQEPQNYLYLTWIFLLQRCVDLAWSCLGLESKFGALGRDLCVFQLALKRPGPIFSSLNLLGPQYFSKNPWANASMKTDPNSHSKEQEGTGQSCISCEPPSIHSPQIPPRRILSLLHSRMFFHFDSCKGFSSSPKSEGDAYGSVAFLATLCIPFTYICIHLHLWFLRQFLENQR